MDVLYAPSLKASLEWRAERPSPRASKGRIEELPSRRSFGTLAEGKIVCVMEAPSKQDVAGFFKSKSMPVDSIVQMDFEGESGQVTRL